MTPAEKDKQRRLAIVMAARVKWKDQRIALVELHGQFTLRALTGVYDKEVRGDGSFVFRERHHDVGGINRLYWTGLGLDEAEKMVKS